MGTTLIALLVLFGAILLWLDGARARELAASLAEELCRRRDYQFLDQTVALTRVGLTRTPDGLRLRRVFRFDYSVEGYGREQGHLLMHGRKFVDAQLREPDAVDTPPQSTGEAATKKGDDNVIPFRKRH